MNFVEMFKPVEQEYCSMLDIVVKHGDKETLNKQWKHIVQSLREIEESSRSHLTEAKNRDQAKQCVKDTKDYMHQLTQCLIYDCNPERFPNWKRVDPSDPKWKSFYIPLCLHNGERQMGWIDYMMKSEERKKGHTR